MNPGRELDALVAEKVMGFKWAHGLLDGGIAMTTDATYNLLNYSTDIAAAWQVVEKTKLLHKAKLFVGSGGNWMVMRSPENGSEVLCFYAETAPHAICLAALKAVGSEGLANY